ncbi:MAG TPA: type II secretion system F family protein [Candidatus Saccharibacteria bacterium]|nr:type II secretion system F family protein [Candidatus Saccharibacteria bacterium]
MLTYQYAARNPQTGELIKSVVQADSEMAAAKLLKQQGLVATNIAIERRGFSFGGRTRVKAKDRVLFSRQLSTLINAGLPLLQALRSVASQTTDKNLRIILGQIIGDIEGGATLANSMAKHPKVFNQVYIALIAAGESSGTLDKALERLAVQQEKDADLNAKIKGAMIYPIVVMGVMIVVVGFMVVKVLPQVKVMYTSMPGANLPVVTRVLLAVSDFTIKYWWVEAVVLAIIGFLTTKWARTGPGKEVIDKWKMHAWPVGGLFMKVYMARFTRTGETLVASGVPLLQVLGITSRAVSNIHIERAIVRAADKVKTGKSLAESIANDTNFLPLVPNMIRIGEESGSLEDMMAKVADYYEKEVDNEVKNISTIIEPVMMIMLGIVAFVIVAAVLLPIYGLAGQTDGIGR